MKTIVVAAAVIEREGRVLLTQRQTGTHLEGLWEFIGGKVEDGESPEEALVRECREEAGIEIRVRDILDVTYHRYPQKAVLLLFYDCDLVGGEIEHREIADHVWCEPERLGDYPLPPPDDKVVAKIKARARRA